VSVSGFIYIVENDSGKVGIGKSAESVRRVRLSEASDI